MRHYGLQSDETKDSNLIAGGGLGIEGNQKKRFNRHSIKSKRRSGGQNVRRSFA
jgi:hypothetical protein